MVIFEENYGCFVVLSSLLAPNFNALFNSIQGLLRKPRLLLIVNFLFDFPQPSFTKKSAYAFLKSNLPNLATMFLNRKSF